MKNIATLFAFVCLLFVSQSAYAVKTATAVTGETVEVTATTATSTTLSKKDMKKQARLEKRIAKMEKKAAAQDIDFQDDTNKWKNFWIIGWGGGIILIILGAILAVGGALSGGFGIGAIIALLGYLAVLFGSVSLVIWLVKKFS